MNNNILIKKTNDKINIYLNDFINNNYYNIIYYYFFLNKYMNNYTQNIIKDLIIFLFNNKNLFILYKHKYFNNILNKNNFILFKNYIENEDKIYYIIYKIILIKNLLDNIKTNDINNIKKIMLIYKDILKYCNNNYILLLNKTNNLSENYIIILNDKLLYLQNELLKLKNNKIKKICIEILNDNYDILNIYIFDLKKKYLTINFINEYIKEIYKLYKLLFTNIKNKLYNIAKENKLNNQNDIIKDFNKSTIYYFKFINKDIYNTINIFTNKLNINNINDKIKTYMNIESNNKKLLLFIKEINEDNK